MLEANTKKNDDDNRGKNPNSLANLVPGGKLGTRVKLTKDLVQRTVDFLADNREEFEARFNRLSDRDYVAATLKMMEFVIPKKSDVTVEALPVVDWNINVVPNPSQAAQIQAAQAANKKLPFEPLIDGESGVEDVTPEDVNES